MNPQAEIDRIVDEADSVASLMAFCYLIGCATGAFVTYMIVTAP